MFNFPFQETSTLIPPKSLNNKQNNVQTPVYSRSKVFCKKGVLNNFAKLTGNYLCHILLFNKKRLWHRFFLVHFAKLLGTSIFIVHIWWLKEKLPT